MARTTETAVKGILLKDYDADDVPSLQPFIDSATVIVDRVKTCAVDRSRTLTTAELELIERWLAAHFYCQSDQTYASRNTGKSSGQFQGQTGLQLDSSKYGQHAKALDYSGCLAALAGAERKVARGAWLGKPPSDQVDYEDRD